MDTGRHRGSYHTGNPFGYLGIADRMDNHDKLQRRERTVCFNSAAKVSDSGKLYKAFYRHRYSEFHADVQEYFDNSNFLMYNINSVRACSFILYVKNAFQTEKAIYECGTYPWNVPGIHVYGRYLLYP